MSISLTDLSPAARDFVAAATADAIFAFGVLKAEGALNQTGTVGFIERIPGAEALVSFKYPGPWKTDEPIVPTILPLDEAAGPGRFNSVFLKYPEITTFSHVHPPHLSAWSQTHKPFPILYAPVARNNLITELPAYIDRTQDQAAFILDQLEVNPRIPGILECNGGATVWGKDGILKLAQFILLLEEAATIQIRAGAIGGSKPFGPGVLKQQLNMTGRYEEAQDIGLVAAR